MKRKLKTEADLEHEAQRLIETGKMPSFDKLINTISQTREKYRERIVAARKEEDEN